MEQQSAESGKQQGRCDVKSRKDGDEDGRAEHCEHVLDSQNQHFGSAKGACVVHGSINHGFSFISDCTSLCVVLIYIKGIC